MKSPAYQKFCMRCERARRRMENHHSEKLYGRQPNTEKSNVVKRIKNVSETEPKKTFSPSDFEEELDSTISVRERIKGSKLEGHYKRKAGKVIKETEHTIPFLPKMSKKEMILSKRDVVKDTAEKEKAGTSRQRERGSSEWPTEEETSDDETYIRPESEDDEETTITSNSENVTTEEEDNTAKIEEEEERPAEKNDAEEKKKKAENVQSQENGKTQGKDRRKEKGNKGHNGVDPCEQQRAPKAKTDATIRH